MTEANPYNAPRAHVADVAVAGTEQLPSRWLRIAGVIVDAIAVSVITIPTLFLSGYFAQMMQTAAAGQQPSVALQVGGAAFGFAVFLAVHGYLLWSNGQTLGKRLLGMKIVDMQTRQKPAFGWLVAMRFLVPQVVYMIPIVGGLVALVGILLIFREDRRPLHDHLARTQVVVA
ncbi:MAG TPA: RDD family protein [Xanthomonadales bacterium]|nr:RDD family protein [Xanthomonadales bacterium]